MSAETILLIIGVLMIVLAILVVIMLFVDNDKTSTVSKAKKTNTFSKVNKGARSFDELRKIVKNSSTSKEELNSAIDEIIKYYPNIHPKLGIRVHPEFELYSETMLYLCRAKNTSKDIILKLDKALIDRNPSYKSELEDALKKGLNSLGV